MNLADYIEQSNRATTVDCLFRTFEQAMSDQGLDRVIFSLMTDHVALKKEAVHGLVRNYPGHWMDYYVDANYEHVDPVRLKMFSSSTPFLWGQMMDQECLTKAQMAVMLEADESGLHCGVGIPLRSGRGALAGVGAASTDHHLELTPDMVSHANLISFQFYTCYQSLMALVKDAPAIALTDREREILNWSAAGCTKQDIAIKLCLSKHTVDYHTRHILSKFDARNITQAVVKAISLGLIQA